MNGKLVIISFVHQHSVLYDRSLSDQTYDVNGEAISERSHLAAKFPANRLGELALKTSFIPGGHLSPLVPSR